MKNFTPKFLNDAFAELRKSIASTSYLENMPAVICADGFKMSVQASKYHYCSPRDDEGPYESVEVGYPSSPEPLLGITNDGDVWGYVPVEIICNIVNKHGGFKEWNGKNTESASIPEDEVPDWIYHAFQNCTVVDGYWCPPKNEMHLENVFMVDIHGAAYNLSKLKISKGWILGVMYEKGPVSIKLDAVQAIGVQQI